MNPKTDKYCQHCGAIIPKSATFCQFCGAKQIGMSNELRLYDVTNTSLDPTQRIPNHNTKRPDGHFRPGMKFFWNQFIHNIFNGYGCTDQRGFNYVYIPIYLLFVIVVLLIGRPFSDFFSLIFILTIGLCIRRVHDMGYSGWYAIVLFIPLVNIPFIIFLIFDHANKEANEKYKQRAIHKNHAKMV